MTKRKRTIFDPERATFFNRPAEYWRAVNKMTNWQNHQWMKSGMKTSSAEFFSKLAYGSGRR